MPEIIYRLRDGAAEHGYAFWEQGARLLVNLAISRAITKAAKQSRPAGNTPAAKYA